MAQPTVTVFGSSIGEPGEPGYDAGVELGRLLAEAGYAVATGGYDGTMVAVSEGAHAANGQVIGVTAPTVFPHRETANRFVKEQIRAASLTERIHELINLADVSLALPGSIGTFTELMVAWNLAFVARFSDTPPRPVIAVGAIWRRIVAQLADEFDTELEVVTCVDTVPEAVAEVKRRVPLH